jgi:hypothetical protein
MSAFPGALTRAHSGAHRRENTGIARQWLISEHRKNGQEFPVSRANHQRVIDSMAAGGSSRAGKRQKRKQKGRREAGLF